MTAIDSIRLFHPGRADRLAVVSVSPAAGAAPASGQGFMITVARGKSRNALTDARMFGPLSAEDLTLAHKSVVDGLLAEGYVHAGLGVLLQALQEKNPRVRARAAWRLGWRRERGGVEALLRLVDKPKEDITSVIDALGLIGDARVIPAARAEAEKKLLSRRRAGVEALKNLGDREGMAAARERALERLPATVRAAVGAQAQPIVDAVAACDVKERGIAIDTLYELGGIEADVAVAAACISAARRSLLTLDVHLPHVWRYAKSVWKRSMLRFDHETFGALTHRFEIASRKVKSVTATLKSGYDGEPRKTRVFAKETVDYIRRRTWRFLRSVAQHRPATYAVAAAEALVPYVDGDDVLQANAPATGRSYVLHKVLFSRSARTRLDGRAMRFKLKQQPKGSPPATLGAREEAFPALWDLTPRAYVRLLGAGKHSAVQRFALDGIARNPAALAAATHAEVAALLDSDDARIVDLGLAELKRRFDPRRPDLELVYELARSPKDLVRQHGMLWLGESAPVWTRDRGWLLRFLGIGHGAARDAVSRIAAAAVVGFARDEQGTLIEELLGRLEGKESEEGAFSGYAAVLLALASQTAEGCPVARAVALVGRGNDSAIAVGAAVLARKPGALDVLGASHVLAMATHEKAAVRAAALTLLAGATETLARDPSALFGLVESDWDDVRAGALRLLAGIDLMPLGLDGLLGLADSTRPEVQRKAHEILRRALASGARIDVHELLSRLAQHPSSITRAFAVSLALEHLKPGFVRLAKLELLFRSALFDVWPDRKVKRAVIAFLAERGEQDENQAEVAAQILGDFVRTQCVDDRERALQALVRIHLAFPATTKSPVTLVGAA